MSLSEKTRLSWYKKRARRKLKKLPEKKKATVSNAPDVDEFGADGARFKPEEKVRLCVYVKGALELGPKCDLATFHAHCFQMMKLEGAEIIHSGSETVAGEGPKTTAMHRTRYKVWFWTTGKTHVPRFIGTLPIARPDSMLSIATLDMKESRWLKARDLYLQVTSRIPKFDAETKTTSLGPYVQQVPLTALWKGPWYDAKTAEESVELAMRTTKHPNAAAAAAPYFHPSAQFVSASLCSNTIDLPVDVGVGWK